MNDHHTDSGDIRQQIRDAIRHLEHILPGQAPIKDFVHHNTLHGYQHLPFADALAAARRLTGAKGYLPLEKYQAFHRLGRITIVDLAASIDEDAALQAEAVVAETATGALRRRDIYLAALTMPLQPVSGCQLNWQIEEINVLESLRSDLPETARARLLDKACASGHLSEAAAVNDLWHACLEVLQLEHNPTHPEELLDLAPEQAETMLHDLLDEAQTRTDAPNTTTQLMQQAAEERLSSLLERVGNDYTLRDLLRGLTGEDLLDQIRPRLVRELANFLDQGVASWRPDFDNAGFYAYWRENAANDPNWQLHGIEGWRQHLELLHNDPLDTIVSELHRLGLARERWVGYLQHLALELPGWSGMVLWRHNHPDYQSLTARVDMLDYLAVRLVLERIHAHNLCATHFCIESSLDMLRWYFRHQPDEFTVREALFNSRLPEYLASRAQRAVHAPDSGYATDAGTSRWQHLAQLIWTWRLSSGMVEATGRPTLCQGAWPLFQITQQLGWCGTELRTLSYEQVQAVFECIERLNEDRMGYLWLCAYEKHYRDEILTALAQNRGRGAWTNRDTQPAAQLVFCMDDREEGLRRHLEEIFPEVETLGTAAHFNVPHNWRGLDDRGVTPLAPVVPAPVIPAHEVREVPRPKDEAVASLHRKRHHLLQRGRELFLQATRRGLVLPGVLAVAAAPVTLVVLAGKILAPRTAGRLLSSLRQAFEKPLATQIDCTAPNHSSEATAESPRLGFTDPEQADRVETLLRGTGLTAGFAPVVAIVGHASRNQNNPHASAYNCGACAGRFSGPNGRLVAAMANRREVRTILADRGIVISPQTWFVGAEHDTCSDEIAWYDLEAMPADQRPALQRLQAELDRACQLHAQERCRRFASAPSRPTPQRAFRHVAGRAVDFSQARPELGHATNACAFIGRRALSRGAFFDRRAFLISYDPTQDPSGEVLERHLLTNGAVGAGISLEYYFSTVDNEQYGCGSKVTHNVAGFLGVMEGAASDLRTGLPQQMIEIHEAMRLLVVVEAQTNILSQIYGRQPPLQALVGNGWLQLAAIDPESGEIHRFSPDRGWLPWLASADALPMVKRSADWCLGSMGPMSPALIETAEEGSAHA
ncbi:MAG: DUF2309 domain-containing protein [Candidatus Thiodiazotropha sp. (ex Dulcina madagascariensis)]|nr:DUF2309 domain-containing protein [Candidatus Thiodiazotropha sp. (ex Dulcina madagascariensis)]MCU7926734.1 DUF2309 domain-containing protein [Candidatus Thiodiazotropha sp. (ex Dulcina madagascariensis)]